MRLDRLLCQHPKWNRRHVLGLLVQGRVTVNEAVVTNPTHEVSAFDTVHADGELCQAGKPAHYLMLNKPAGILSATSDPVHPTVMQLLPEALAKDLHIGGRLDRASTGLMLLTNDGQWSRRATDPDKRSPKVYRVTLADPIHADTERVFAEGIHFPFENITTSPAQLERLGECECRLTIYEGRYHQIKRMFGRFRNPVVALHRESMGAITLDPTLAPGQYRPLTAEEIASV
ncbi:pseudouridine synthase [Ferrimonas balearica]|uniref:pseudouridine synthase n=1 Tax=Ferrimonas balearica TaxID=44012 RepID=UPI001F25F35E|nr:pseudouridine synthase [Ferrimonas balearica]MBY6017784.1 pseudouridine synthase [Halomonas denitrificans]MBY6094142.1 pseudouridine synthase [Ferrimonas balearica]